MSTTARITLSNQCIIVTANETVNMIQPEILMMLQNIASYTATVRKIVEIEI